MKAFEQEADMAAAHWMLDGMNQEDERFVKRALGVALASSWLASLAVYVPQDKRDHPPSVDRLYKVINRYVPDPNHVVWAFVSTILRANMEARKMDYDKQREVNSFKDDAEYCISIFKHYEA